MLNCKRVFLQRNHRRRMSSASCSTTSTDIVGPPTGSCEVDMFPVSLLQDSHPVVRNLTRFIQNIWYYLRVFTSCHFRDGNIIWLLSK